MAQANLACNIDKKLPLADSSGQIIARQSFRDIRTGCVTCHRAGIKCVHDQRLNSEWKVNSDLAWQWQGTWRERRGLHVFIGFIVAPGGITGFFESDFWHRTVMLACYNNSALFHIASAIGSLFEHAAMEAVQAPGRDGRGLAFALAQCNRSITRLKGEEGNDAEVSMTASVLFTLFQALQGEAAQASAHSLQSRKLLKHLEGLESNGQTVGLIRSEDVVPIVGTVEIQAKSLQGSGMMRSETGTSALPDTAYLANLNHAHRIFYYVYSRLLVWVQDFYVTEGETSALTAEKRATFAVWLQEWGKAFFDLLDRPGTVGDSYDHARAQILQANYITASMMASNDQGSDRHEWDDLEKAFNNVVDLSASILDTFNIMRPPMLDTTHLEFPFLSYGLWVDQPLYITMARCANPEIQRRAAGLLIGERERRPWHNRSLKHKRYTLLEWVEFAVRTRIDTGMAVFFGGFDEREIRIPGYDAHRA